MPTSIPSEEVYAVVRGKVCVHVGVCVWTKSKYLCFIFPSKIPPALNTTTADSTAEEACIRTHIYQCIIA